jgi:hypothetical protein
MNPTTKPSTSPLSAWIDPHPKLDGVALIDHLFNKLDGLYPHRWRSAFANQHAIANWRQAWAEGFADECVTLAEIKLGMAACRTRFAWPPSFAEFLSACRPPVDFESAFREAVEQMRRRESDTDEWSSPAIYWAAVEIGSFDLRNGIWPSIKPRWTSVLQSQLDKHEWLEIPPRLPVLPAPGQCSIAQSEALRRIAEMQEMIARKMCA